MTLLIIVVAAGELVCDAERAIAAANPPHSKVRSFRRATMLGSIRFETFAVLTSWTMASMSD